MNINVYILDSAKTLKQYKKDLQEISKEAIQKTIKLIHVDDVDIVLYDNPQEAIEHIALGGYTPNPHIIFLSLNPQKENFKELVKGHLGRQIAHELHHALRWRDPGYGFTLLEAMVTEGLADHFMYEVYPGELEEWDKKEILADTLEEISKQAKREYTNTTYNHGGWFLGGNTGQIPQWAGYVLGYQLVDAYLKKHPGEKASGIYSIRSEEFLK